MQNIEQYLFNLINNLKFYTSSFVVHFVTQVSLPNTYAFVIRFVVFTFHPSQGRRLKIALPPLKV